MSIVILDCPRQNLCSVYDPKVLGLELFVNSAIMSSDEYFPPIFINTTFVHFLLLNFWIFSSFPGEWSPPRWSRSSTLSLGTTRSSSTGSSWESRASSVSSQRRSSVRSATSTAENSSSSSRLSSHASLYRSSRWAVEQQALLSPKNWISRIPLHGTRWRQPPLVML